MRLSPLGRCLPPTSVWQRWLALHLPATLAYLLEQSSSLPIRFTGRHQHRFYFSAAANDFSIATGGTRRAHFDATASRSVIAKH